MNRPLVSVIVPCYNGEKVIGECLKSVFRADYPRSEVIVVDDCSPDGSAEIVSRDFPGARLVRNPENRGFAPTANAGAREARGEIIALLNMDTVVERGWLEGMVGPLERDPAVGLVGSKILFPGKRIIQHAGGRILPNGLTLHIGRGEEDRGQFEEALEVDYVCGASLGFRRDLFRRLGGFREIYSPLYYEDTDLALRARRAGYKVVYAPGSVLVHQENISTAGLSPSFYYYFHRSRIRFVLRNFGIPYFLKEFLPAERKWRESLPPEVRGPLKRAYRESALGWPRIVLARWADRFRPARADEAG